MEVLRFPNFIDLDSSYKREVFRVDDFLDFTSDEFLDAPILNCDAKSNQAADGCTNNKAGVEPEDTNNKPGFGDGLEQVDIPDELEWLSNFVEDSSSIEDELPKHAFKSTSNEALKRTRVPVGVKGEDGSPASGLESSSTSAQVFKDQFLDLPATATATATTTTTTAAVPGRARSKRSRAGTPNRKFMSYDILEATTPSSSSDYQDSGAPSDPSSVLDDTGLFTAESNFRDERPPAPKKKKTSSSSKKQLQQQQQQVDTGSSSSVQQQTTQQKCLHCGSQKTPQWRAGPLGPKTLCNACGVRFKSGRLYPEYRPAASPSFVPQKHSNSHKRVLEMRKQKFESEEAAC